MMHALEMPDSPSGLRVQSKQGIGKQIVTHAVGAIKVEDRRSRGHIYNASLGVERHSGPTVGSAGLSPGIFRPGFVSRLAGMRNGIASPAKRSRSNIKRATIPGRRRVGLRIAAADDNQILVDNAWAG